MYSYLLTGIIAGIASSILYVSGTIGTPLSLFLYFLAPLPLFIAGLGWGAVSAAVGAIAGVIVCITLAGFPDGLVYFISIGLIPVILTYYALLSRTADAGAQPPSRDADAHNWYPFGYLILWITGFATLITAVIILFIMPSPSELQAPLQTLFSTILNQKPELKTALGGDSAVQQLVALFIALLPVTLASYTFTTTTANLWLASKIITASGRSLRPAFRLSSLYYPRLLPVVLGGLLVLTFFPGFIHTIALAGTMSLSLAFVLLGLLVVHAIVPNVPARILFFGAFYVTVFIILKYAFLAFALLGIAETIFNIRARFTPPPAPGNHGPPPTMRDD